MDKKILKYKVKKNKLENKLMDILMTKKTNYENDIINSNNNSNIINKIENFLNILELSESIELKQLFIVVKGDYSVGKSTFISHLKNYITKMSKIILSQNTLLKLNIQFKLDLINITTFNNFDINLFNNPIVIIEVNTTQITSNIISDIVKFKNVNVQILNVKILPKDFKSLKNKYINKIIYNIYLDTNDFVINLNLNEEIKTNLQNNINLLKLKTNNYFNDNDFDFLNEPVDIIFNFLNKHDENTNTYTDGIVFYM